MLQTARSGLETSKGLELPFSTERAIPSTDPPTQNPLPAADAPSTDSERATNSASRAKLAVSGLYPNDRLTSRLSDLAKDDDLSEWFSGESLESGQNPFALESENAIESETLKWDTDEIVLDDEAPLVPTSRALVKPEVPQSFQLSPDEPVPAPELVVPRGTLTSGRSIAIRVKLPQLKPRIYVKLWIYDRQNQALLEGPVWLTDFLPAEPGQVEIITPLTIPHGGLEVQVEAIAVEMQTQRESRKVTVEREVVPAPPPALPLSEKAAIAGANLSRSDK